MPHLGQHCRPYRLSMGASPPPIGPPGCGYSRSLRSRPPQLHGSSVPDFPACVVRGSTTFPSAFLRPGPRRPHRVCRTATTTAAPPARARPLLRATSDQSTAALGRRATPRCAPPPPPDRGHAPLAASPPLAPGWDWAPTPRRTPSAGNAHPSHADPWPGEQADAANAARRGMRRPPHKPPESDYSTRGWCPSGPRCRRL
jgi:hypothetical protein